MEINTTIFQVETLTNGYFNQAKLMSMTKDLKGVKLSLESSRDEITNNMVLFEYQLLLSLDIQLVIIDKNLENLNTALLMKEAVSFEHRIEFEYLDAHIFCLN